MKKQTAWTERNRKLVAGETPFAEIEIVRPDGKRTTVRMYWTKGGVYGPQVTTFLYADGDVWTDRTGGCGYSKKDAAFESVARHLGLEIPGYSNGAEFVPWRYAVGGNYWLIDLRGPVVVHHGAEACEVCGAEYGKVHRHNCPNAKGA